MIYPFKSICKTTLAVFCTFFPALYAHATPEQKSNSDVSYKDIHASQLYLGLNDTHPNPTSIIQSKAASSAVGVLLTSSSYKSYKDTHDNELALSFNEASIDTHSKKYTNTKPLGLTQVPYSALGVLPTREHDAQFSYGEDPLQTVYVWHGRARGQSELSGDAVIFVHGGCWLNAYGYDHAKGFYYALAELGVGVYAMEYRRVGDEGGGWPGSLNDVVNGMKASIKQIVATGDNRNIYVVGHSAGGHLGLLAAQQLSDSEQSRSIKRVIGLAAITNVHSYARGKNSCQAATQQFIGGMPSDKELEYQMATPVATAIQPPVILLQGTEDSIVPEHHATMPNAKNRIITNGGHFDWLHPDSSSFDALLEVLGEHDK